MRSILLCSFALLALKISAQSYNGPESVEFDYANNRYLVANKNNGQIIARSPSGTLTVFASGMTSGPYGIEILGNTLYCCYGGGKLRGYDLTTGAQVMDKNLGGTFLNGITSDGTKNLYITDFSAKKIYRFNTLTQTSNVFVTGLTKSPNGIIYDGANNRCVFVNWGTNAPIMAASLADSTTSTLITTTFGNIDGIARDGQGNYFIAAWSNNTVQKYTSTFSSPTAVATGLSSPADIFYNTVSDTLAIPNSGTASNVVFIGFPNPTSIEINIEKQEAIFPNPSNGKIRILSGNIMYDRILILDITGKTVLEKDLSGTGSQEIILEKIPSGTYLYKLYSENKIKEGKLILSGN